jgi:hypothetical protein
LVAFAQRPLVIPEIMKLVPLADVREPIEPGICRHTFVTRRRGASWRRT